MNTRRPTEWCERPRLTRLALLLLAVVLIGGCSPEPALPTLYPAPGFALTDQDGAAFGTEQLGGRATVVNFIYTRCTDTCPLLSSSMGEVQEQLKHEGLFGTKVMLLSFSLDPERDTPAVLKAYGERFGMDPDGWKMLTGSVDELGQVAQEFKLGRPIPLPLSPQNPVINLAHSNRFLLVDGEGQVRATYPGEALNAAEVVRDVKRLVR